MYLKQRIRELDVVELTEPTGHWPAGSRGTVMIDFGEDKMLEMVGEREGPPGSFSHGASFEAEAAHHVRASRLRNRLGWWILMIVSQTIHEHDSVRLRRQVGRWPAGQSGAVVAEKGIWKLIEIADDRGVMLDLISVAETDLELVGSAQTRAA